MGLVSKNYEIECAIVEIEKEILDIRKRKAEKTNNQITQHESESNRLLTEDKEEASCEKVDSNDEHVPMQQCEEDIQQVQSEV